MANACSCCSGKLKLWSACTAVVVGGFFSGALLNSVWPDFLLILLEYGLWGLFVPGLFQRFSPSWRLFCLTALSAIAGFLILPADSLFVVTVAAPYLLFGALMFLVFVVKSEA